MKKGNVIVEQVNSRGDIVFDYDCSLKSDELYDRLCAYFEGIRRDACGVICGSYHGQSYMVRIKNITYLGIPHPHFKKRIQIADDLKEFYRYAVSHHAVPVLMGLYTYNDTAVFCDFEIEDYVKRKAHNSSAHIYTNDISRAVIDGYFTKTDFCNNHITVFRADNAAQYLRYKFGEEPHEFKSEIVRVVDSLFEVMSRHWYGIPCYQEMIAADYPNKYQPEWPGFYLEYLLAESIRSNHLEGIMRYAQDKSEGGIDLDLYFPTVDCYGDLKTHAEKSNGILGNDWETIHRLINEQGPAKSVYYIVLELRVVKDSECGYEVTHFWNEVQKKEDLMSYCTKMKHDVEVTGYYILEINRNNQQYLTKFNQGKNSNGKPRNPKIMIGKKEIGNFLIYRKKFKA